MVVRCSHTHGCCAGRRLRLRESSSSASSSKGTLIAGLPSSPWIPCSSSWCLAESFAQGTRPLRGGRSTFKLQLDPGVPEEIEEVLEVIEVFIAVLREDDDIVDVHQAHTPTDIGEDDIKRTLEGRRRIAETERHAEIYVLPHVTRERCLISSAMSTCQYPQRDSRSVKTLAPDRLSM